jgi:hypothetical protein
MKRIEIIYLRTCYSFIRMVGNWYDTEHRYDRGGEMITTQNKPFGLVLFGTFLAGLLLAGCQTAYYGTMEKLGVHKRDIMVDRVEAARDAQTEAKEQFQSALEQFTATLHIKGGELEEKYKTLNKTYEQSKEKADAVHSRIAKVEDVAEALFDEWEKELSQYASDTLRKDSQAKLKRTKKQYQQLIAAMKRAEKKIEPVLAAFHDQVLYLKHNLNAQAIASLQDELIAVEDDIASLIKEMESAIQEANAFLSTLNKP